MINFYPGPSKVSDKISDYFAEAHASGFLSVNHRSEQFMSLVKGTNALLKSKLEIPDEYGVFYLSSATECWEVIAESYSGINYHFYNGSFGEKWFDASRKIKPQSIGYKFDPDKELRLGELDLSMEDGLLCVTHNETSNGTTVSNKRIGKIRKKYPNHLIAVDATSSMAGDYLQFENADIWYASVQKCFGLPAGLAVLICSPIAINKAIEQDKNRHYNSLINIISNMKKSQTTHTPNVADIFLLNKVLGDRKSISKESNRLKKRANDFFDFLDSKKSISPLINKDSVKSTTVFALKADPKIISDLKLKAEKSGIILGNGYGIWKESTFRIANFPAITNQEMKKLIQFLDDNLT